LSRQTVGPQVPLQSRSRAELRSINRDTYLRKLNHLYSNWVERYDPVPKITIVTDKLNYLTDLCDPIYLLKRIEKHIPI